MSPVTESAPVTFPPSLGGDNLVMELLLLSHMSVTNDYIAKHRETKIMYTPVRSFLWEVDDLQPDWQPDTQTLLHRDDSTEVSQNT